MKFKQALNIILYFTTFPGPAFLYTTLYRYASWQETARGQDFSYPLSIGTFYVTIQAVWIGSLLNDHFLG